jgi:putative ABC transport system permease protein
MLRLPILETFARDLRFALRMLWRTRGVSGAAILALALGIGANTAIFSVVDGVLLRPLPFPDSRSLYQIHTGTNRDEIHNDPLSYPQYQDLVAQARSFQSLGAWVDGDANLSGTATPERVLLRSALPSLLPTLGVQPVRGRNFLPDETVEGRHRVALISHELWRRQFAGEESAVGKTVRLDGADYLIVGVLPRGFQLETATDVWIPQITTSPALQVRNAHFLNVIARIRPGATAAGIAADLDVIAKRQSDTFPQMFPPKFGFGFRGRPYLEAIVGEVRLPLLILLGAVGFVLVITCANVANLLLARAAAREREMAIRRALGAGRRRLMRQLLTESLVLSLAGGLLGVLFAGWGVDALVLLSPESLPRVSGVALDARVLLFTALVASATGIAFGLVPAISQSRPDMHDALKQGMFGSSSSRGRLRSALVVAEVAICLVLLVGAGLMLRSFVRLRDVDPGFRVDQALTFRVSLPARGVATDGDRARFVDFFKRATTRLQQLPGVTAAGAGDIVPLDGQSRGRLIDVEGYVRRDSSDMPSAQNRRITPGWFRALGIPLVDGRPIEPSDDASAPPVVVVNQAFVRRYFPDGAALGKRFRLGKLTQEFPWATIVGVVGDVRGRRLDAPPRSEMYWPLAQINNRPSMAIVVRTLGDPAALVSSVRAAMTEVDATQPIFGLQTLEQLAASSLGQRRFTLILMLVFGGLALALAAVGIYGVMAYAVSQRTREIGIRVALGARPASVLAMVIKTGMLLVALGTAIGTLGALLVTRVAASLLYGVSSTDAPTYLAIAAVLSAVALVAMVLPARQAMKVDPMRALRSEQ